MPDAPVLKLAKSLGHVWLTTVDKDFKDATVESAWRWFEERDRAGFMAVAALVAPALDAPPTYVNANQPTKIRDFDAYLVLKQQYDAHVAAIRKVVAP
jgi:hypothetical protein